jgi:hypothetical protein
MKLKLEVNLEKQLILLIWLKLKFKILQIDYETSVTVVVLWRCSSKRVDPPRNRYSV